MRILVTEDRMSLYSVLYDSNKVRWCDTELCSDRML